MILKSNSPKSPISAARQATFPSGLCGKCPQRSFCDARDTQFQCELLSPPRDDIRPCTADGEDWEFLLDGFDIRAKGPFSQVIIPGGVPRIALQRDAGFAAQDSPWVAVTLTEALYRSGTRVRSRDEVIARGHLKPSTKVMLVMTGSDAALSALGIAPDELVHSVLVAGFDLVLSPQFSVWDDHTPFHNRAQIVYIDRYGSHLAEEGVPTVRAAAWFLESDIRHQADAIQKNGSVGLVWADAQTIPWNKASWHRFLNELDLFASLVPEVGFIVNGVSKRRRADLWQRDYVASIISSDEFISAVRQNKGPDRKRVARQQICDFLEESRTHRSS